MISLILPPFGLIRDQKIIIGPELIIQPIIFIPELNRSSAGLRRLKVGKS